MTTWRAVVVLGGLSALLSYLVTMIVRTYALRAGVLDQPNDRSSHSVPTPRGGGLAILAAATVAITVGGLANVIAWRDAMTLGIGAWTIGLLGWLDDHRSLRPNLRLGVQLLVACWTVYRFGGLPTLRVGSIAMHLHWFGFFVAVIGLIWSINLFNFMDGIDALAGSQAALIFLSLGLLLLALGDRSLGLISCVLAGGAIGFLPWNWPRARIFLGDVGSAPIGYLLASLAVASENRGEVPMLVVAIMGSVFIVDATITLARRSLRRERLSQAHRSHAYQRLARALDSHGRVSFWAAIETALFASLGAAATMREALLIPAALLTIAVLAASLVYIERRAPMDGASASPARGQHEVLGRNRQRLVNR